jgi:hypothetical protein
MLMRPSQGMKDHANRNLLLGLALVAVIAGVVIALLSGGAHHHHATKSKQAISRGSGAGDVQLAADYIGISRSELRRRLRSGETMAEVADATPGKSAGGLIAALLAPRRAQVKAHQPSSVLEQEELRRARAQVVAEASHGRGRTGPVATAAAYLGLSEPALRARLRAGESMAQVAKARHRSRSGLIEALVAVKVRRLRTAVAEHAITPAQEKLAIARLHSRVQREVEQHLKASAP